MRPTFRSDLTCSREEQQGVVFYRIDDPKTQTSFRLYEIEYLIAQKLDGKRTLADVIQAVKEEYNFDISEPDLNKFVGQLDSMGFVSKDGDADAAEDSESTQIMRRTKPVAREDDLEMAEPDLLDAKVDPVDDAELKRLLKSALLHVKQGYIVHARDYFLAAKELNPDDARLVKLVSHLEIIGDASGPAEVEYLWNQARELFPDIAEEVGPLLDTRSAASNKVVDQAQRTSQAWDEDLKARIVWLVLAIVLVGGGAGGLYFFAKEARVFEGAARAHIATIKSTKSPVFFESPANKVSAARETWLEFATAGKTSELFVQPGARVATDQVIAALELPPPVRKAIEVAQKTVEKAQADHDKAEKAMAALVDQREVLEADQAAADERLSSLKSKNLLSKGGASKRDLEKWKKMKAAANKKLSALAKKERKPKQDEQKAKQRLTQAKQKLAVLEQRIAQKLVRAPFAGVIQELKLEKGKPVQAGQKVILLRDNLEARLAFAVSDAQGLQPGGEAYISVARGAPSRAKVTAVQKDGEAVRIDLLIGDPAGSFVDMKPSEFRLVREFVDPAFEVPVSAVFSDDKGAHVFIELQGRALVRDVEILSKDAASALIRDRSGALRDGEHLVVERVGATTDVSTILNGSFLEAQN